MIDKLIEQVIAKKSPICVGLDTKFDYIPQEFLSREYSTDPLTYAANNIFQYNCALVDALADIVPAVKVQAAYYEMYGCEGMKAFRDTIRYAKNAGLVVIADVKRNDIGATATAYSSAYIGKTTIGAEEIPVFDADFATVNGYLGTDGIAPFVDDCKKYDKGIFVLVKTSNPSSGELQDKKIGAEARADLEMLFGTKVFLELWVKVKEDWRNSQFMLKELGYREE